jgi:hypothetical protein
MTGRIILVEPQLQAGRREHVATGKCEGPACGLEARRGRRHREHLAGAGRHRIRRRGERIGEDDRRLLGREAHHELHREHAIHGGERVVGGDVLELAGVHLGQTYVQLAHVSHFAPQPGHDDEAVSVVRVAPRQPGPRRGGERPGVGRVRLETDRGTLEREAESRRLLR